MHPLERLELTSRVAKRAQYEAFEFSVGDDAVLVRNCSHADPADHEYRVTIQDGLPSACECPADDRFDGACKHRVAVAIRRPVLEAARRRSVAADGGSSTAGTTSGQDSDDRPDECACEELAGEFPCWPCISTGRRELLRNLITTHLFEDGNKRTAWVTIRAYLSRQDEEPAERGPDAERVLSRTPRYDVEELAEWLETGDIDEDRLHP